MLGFIGDLLGLNQGTPAINAANQNANLLNSLKTEGMGYLNAGDTAAKSALDQSLALTSLGPNANGLYSDALGLNGADGGARAMEAFQTNNPGYQFAQDQGIQALERRAAARGMTGSGNLNLDTLKFSQGLADQNWQQWLNNLNTGINRQVGTLGDQATLAQTGGQAKAGFASDITSGFMDNNNARASGESANSKGLGGLFGNIVGGLFGYGGF